MSPIPLFSVEQLVIYIDNLDDNPYCLAGRIVEVRVPEQGHQEISYLIKLCGERESESGIVQGFEHTEFRESQIYSFELVQREVTKFLELEAKT